MFVSINRYICYAQSVKLPITRNRRVYCPFHEMGNMLAYFVNWALENVPISRIGQMLMLWTKFKFSSTSAGHHAKGVAVWHGSFLSSFHRLHSVQGQRASQKLKAFRYISSNFLYFLRGCEVLRKYTIYLLCSQLQLEPTVRILANSNNGEVYTGSASVPQWYRWLWTIILAYWAYYAILEWLQQSLDFWCRYRPGQIFLEGEFQSFLGRGVTAEGA